MQSVSYCVLTDPHAGLVGLVPRDARQTALALSRIRPVSATRTRRCPLELDQSRVLYLLRGDDRVQTCSVLPLRRRRPDLCVSNRARAFGRTAGPRRHNSCQGCQGAPIASRVPATAASPAPTAETPQSFPAKRAKRKDRNSKAHESAPHRGPCKTTVSATSAGRLVRPWCLTSLGHS